MKEKEDQINIKIPYELKAHYYNICRSRHINPSALIRKWIAQFVESGDATVTFQTFSNSTRVELAKYRRKK
ncbi:hypothetical protein [Bacillus norwichensis]|uniref:CopG family transcriptional regulator n=1 Tax=Bacillus norwichensis TaxID=2762217 RepID=A0ABR8VHJ2_9BACI|nr:hypothetical protein [Bacillus norwichensis]MBD8004247.1 hypothetical protein [Bacillus norwichensis]